MASRASLNKVLLIGNLTRDPEMRYTPQGNAVCTFGLATNRSFVTSDGQRKEETEFHRIVSWNKLAELCAQLLVKGRKVYVEGRLQTRSFQTPDGQNRQITEIVIDDMRILDPKPKGLEVEEEVETAASAEVPGELGEVPVPEEAPVAEVSSAKEEKSQPKKAKGKKEPEKKVEDKVGEENPPKGEEDLDLSDLPF